MQQFKGVIYRPTASRNSQQEQATSAHQKSGKPSNESPSPRYGRIKEVLGGKRVKVVYYDDNKKDVEIKEPVSIIEPGREAIKTLYGGLKPGLPVRIDFRGEEPDPTLTEVRVAVIGGPDDDISKAEQDPEPEELAIAAYKLFSGGMLA